MGEQINRYTQRLAVPGDVEEQTTAMRPSIFRNDKTQNFVFDLTHCLKKTVNFIFIYIDSSFLQITYKLVRS